MSINALTSKGTVEANRAILKVGSQVIDWLQWDIDHSGVQQAGMFNAEISAPIKDWSWWAQQTEILVDVYAGIPKNPLSYTADDLTPIMTARCDMITLHPDTQTISLGGRDLSSLLIDNKTTEKWQNLTASDIALIIAKQWGMEYDIQPTTEIVGTYYNSDHVKLAKAETYWNILTYLAQREAAHTAGFQVFVLGRKLYFGVYGSAKSSDPYLIQFNTSGNAVSANVESLELVRNLTLANDISVTVRSYHGYRGAAFVATAKATKNAKRVQRDALLAQDTQHYDFTVPGLTQAGCQLKAQQLLNQISTQELRISGNLAFDTALYPWVDVQVAGTGTPWDVTYRPTRVRRHMSKDYVTMNMEAIAGIPQQTITLS